MLNTKTYELERIFPSILNDDLYKLSMQQAVLFSKFSGVSYQKIKTEYEFINRGKTKFPDGFDDTLREYVNSMANLKLTDDEAHFLSKLSYFQPGYIDFLKGYRYDPKEVSISLNNGDLSVKISGYWFRTILWEVKLLALISELYYADYFGKPDLTSVKAKAAQKAKALGSQNITYSDFGTRRRYSNEVHQAVLEGLTSDIKNSPIGTSNVYFANKFNIKAIGTHAHEFFMAHGALFGYQLANQLALSCWANMYDGDLGIALSDTFTSDVFFSQFRRDLALLYNGIRQDSGNPLVFADKVIKFYQSLNIDPMSKTIVFSDSLNVERVLEINKHCDGKIKAAFGIGTFLTNDIEEIKPLNMVIKMTKCNDIPCVKLSDVRGKETGDAFAIRLCKRTLEIETD